MTRNESARTESEPTIEATDATVESDDLPETVIVKGGSAGKRVFHTTEDCSFCPDVTRRWDRESALDWGMRPCTWCASENRGPGGDQGGKRKELYNRLVEIGES